VTKRRHTDHYQQRNMYTVGLQQR